MSIRFLCRFIVFSLLLFSPFVVFAQDVYLCVWRNPERSMTRIFPDAKDYATVNLKVSPQQCEAIEKKLGFKLLAGQRDQFQYFRMTGAGGKSVGTIIAASQKGEFGAIEFVVGFDTTNTLKDIYIQRSRERDQRFKDRAFLDMFKGMTMHDVKKIEKVYSGPKTHGTTAVIHGLMKEIVAYTTLKSVNSEQ